MFMSGAWGPVRLCEMMSTLRHMKQVQRCRSTACDCASRRHTHTRVGDACVGDRQLWVAKHKGAHQFDGVMQRTVRGNEKTIGRLLLEHRFSVL